MLRGAPSPRLQEQPLSYTTIYLSVQHSAAPRESNQCRHQILPLTYRFSLRHPISDGEHTSSKRLRIYQGIGYIENDDWPKADPVAITFEEDPRDDLDQTLLLNRFWDTSFSPMSLRKSCFTLRELRKDIRTHRMHGGNCGKKSWTQ